MLCELKLKDYIKELASNSPAPGGGSAAALCGAQGAGLIAMAAGLTVGKAKYQPHWQHCENTAAECRKLAEKFAFQVEEDTRAFNGISAAYKLPKETERDKQQRKAAIAAATLAATKVPLETMALALAGLEQGQRLLGKFNANCASDLGVGALCLVCAAKGAWLNVKINLSGVNDEDGQKELGRQADDLLAKCQSIGQNIEETINAVIEG